MYITPSCDGRMNN